MSQDKPISVNTLYFLPSQVNLSGMFLDTFKRVEIESTAALIVQVLADTGNIFRIVTCQELALGFQKLTEEEGHWRRWFSNPFMGIDMPGLVKRGFAEWVGDSSIRFTPKGLDQMRKWIY